MTFGLLENFFCFNLNEARAIAWCLIGICPNQEGQGLACILQLFVVTKESTSFSRDFGSEIYLHKFDKIIGKSLKLKRLYLFIQNSF